MKKWKVGILLMIVLGGGFLLSPSLLLADELVNINTAGLEELDILSGIGPSKAQAIIDYRQQNGLFGSKEDIMNVPGIGQATFDKIRDYITISGGSTQQNNEIKIVINEILPNPAGSDDFEWVELKNIGSSVVDLNGWKIADLSKEYLIFTDDFGSTIINSVGFFILNREITKIALNNSGGETLRLYNPEGGLVSEVSYIESAKEDVAWARDKNGEYNWTATLTKGSENIITQTEDNAAEGNSTDDSASNASQKKESKYSDYKDVVLINEFLPNPLGIDDNEWVELYNTSTRAINLDGWKLKDNRLEFNFKNIKIKAKDFLVLNRTQTGLILNNLGGDFLELLDSSAKQVDKVSYKKKAPESESYNWCFTLNKWIWSPEITAGANNKCPPKNKEPVAYFEIQAGDIYTDQYVWLDASESYDKDKTGKIASYDWSFEKAVQIMGQINSVFSFVEPKMQIKFLTAGKQTIKLKVIDDRSGEDECELQVKVAGQVSQPNIDKVYINKFLPNPSGNDTGKEWIELCSSAETDMFLTDFELDDADGGSKPFVLDGYVLPAMGCIQIYNLESKIILNNNHDSVRLLDSGGNLIDEATYNNAKDDFIYRHFEKEVWQWPDYAGSSADANLAANEFVLDLNNLMELKNLGTGSLVRVRGWVAVEPGLLGKTIFYIIDKNSGVQIYSYRKDFPALAMGDKIQVTGMLADYQGEARLKIDSKRDIIKLSHEQLPQPIQIQIEDIGEETKGALVKVRGELTEIKGSSWWLDDKTEEVKIYIKRNTRIKKDKFEPGDTLEITGLLSEYKDEYRILPRYAGDIKLVEKVLGEAAEGKIKETANQDSSEWYKYAIVILVAIVMVLLSVIIRIKNQQLVKNN